MSKTRPGGVRQPGTDAGRGEAGKDQGESRRGLTAGLQYSQAAGNKWRRGADRGPGEVVKNV